MPRLFTGLEVPEEIGFRLSMLRGGVSGAKWIETGDYHLTLSFIGNVDERVGCELAEELAAIEAPRVRVTLDELGSFGGEKPRSIIAIARPSKDLVYLQSRNDRALRRAGVDPDRRKFTPHVTIARVKGASALSIAAFLGDRQIAPLEFTASRFVLYSAKSSQGGGPYVVEEAFPLR
jgi:2'-5' RNA ligase